MGTLMEDLQDRIERAVNSRGTFDESLQKLANFYDVPAGVNAARMIGVASKLDPTVTTGGGAMNYLLYNSSILPTLALDFTTGSLDNRITFTRASTARYFDSTGTLLSAAANTPRFDYNPVTRQIRGLLIEEQRTNFYPYSTDFSASPWGVARATRVATAAIAPDGTQTAIKLVEDTTASNSHYLAAFSTVSFTSGTTYTQTIFARAAERTRFAMSLPSAAFTTEQRVVFNLSSGTATLNSGTPTFAIENVGGGWYRCSMTAAATATATTSVITCYLDNGTSFSYTGDGTSGLFLWGAQLEAGSFATSYIPTVAAQVTRSADSASMTGSNFSSWFNASQGTLVVSAASNYSSTAFPTVISIHDGTSSNAIYSNIRGAGNQGRQEIVSGGVNQVASNTGTISQGVFFKSAGAYAANDCAISVNGGSALADTSATIPTVTTTHLGSDRGTTQFLNGWIARFAFYPARLSNAQLQALTA